MNDKEDLEAFCANLADLYEVGRDTIPSIADQFTAGASALGSANESARGLGEVKYFTGNAGGEHADGSYDVDESGDGPSMADTTLKSATSWKNVCEEFGKVLNNTDANLRLAAGGLLLAIREYAENDEVNEMLITGTGGEPFIDEGDLGDLQATDGKSTETPKDMGELTGKDRE